MAHSSWLIRAVICDHTTIIINSYPKAKHVYYYPKIVDLLLSQPDDSLFFSSLWLSLATLSTCVAAVFGLHEKSEINRYRIFDLSFYYCIPAFLWMLITPLIFSWANQYPIHRGEWKKPLQKHLLYTFLVAPVMRFGALYLDFSIRYIVGMTTTSPLMRLTGVYLVGIGFHSSGYF